jgi:hypothetical protein
MAGTSTTPEITDIAGDANGINGQGQTTVGPQTTPSSVASADLRAVWFETSFKKEKIVDPATGRVTRVRHVPGALLVNVQTTAPIHPASVEGMRPLYYDVATTLPGSCSARFRLTVGATVAADAVTLDTLSAGCATGVSAGGSSTLPTYNGNVTTFRYPLDTEKFGQILQPGATFTGASARVSRPTPFAGNVIIDDAAPSTTTFTFGDGAPADIDCTTTASPDCAP